MFFQVTSPTSASHPQAHTAVGLVIEWDRALAQKKGDTKNKDMNLLLVHFFPLLIFLLSSHLLMKLIMKVFLTKGKGCCGLSL